MVVEGVNDGSVNDVSEHSAEKVLCQSILDANKEAAKKASEALLTLLPRNEAKFVISRVADVTCYRSDSSIKEKFAMRNRLLKFKERAITFKFKAFHHLWKEDMRLLSLRKSRVKHLKKFESSLHVTLNGCQKHRSSIRSRFSSLVQNLSLVPTKEIVSYASQLLSDSKTVHCRSYLKMPALILDEREKTASRFISSNGLVEDPCALEKERAMVNPWTPEEQEIFMDKLAAFGKDFRKIASFLDHKTTADCVEFYYKNHKSECFKRTKKKLEFGNLEKSFSRNTYMVSSRKIWNREMNTVSLDVLGDASLLAAQLEGNPLEPQGFSGMFSLGGCSNSRVAEGDCGVLERTSSFDLLRTDREAVAADVLAGICGSISSEAMSSCITCSLDPGELKYQKADAVTKWPLTPDVAENSENETCSGESCGEMESSDWMDEERSTLIQAVSSYGKDFAMISRCVRTRSMDQCKAFFCKARKCLGLDVIHPLAGPTCSHVSDDDNGGVDSDRGDAFALRTDSAMCGNETSSKMDEDLPASVVTREEDNVSDPVTTLDLQNEVNHSECDRMDVKGQVKVEDSVCCTSKVGPELVVGCVDPLSELVGPEETVMGTSSLEPKFAQGDFQPLASCSPSVVEEPSLPKKGEININGASGAQFSVQDPDVAVDSSSKPVVGMSGGLGFNLNSDFKDKVLDSVETPSFVVSPQEKAATATQCEQSNTLGRVSSGGFDLLVNDEKMGCSNLGHSLNRMESSQILRGYPIQVQAKDMNGNSSHCCAFSDSQSLTRPDSSLTAQYTPPPLNCFLQRCNTTDPCSSISGLPPRIQSSDQMYLLPNSCVQSTAMTDKPFGTDDFKLFGQIISSTPSHQKSNPNNLESKEKGLIQPKFTVTSSNLTTNSSLNGDGSSTLLKYGQNGYVGLGNIPFRSFGLWDGNRKQKGFSTMLDSGVLLAKYPATFSNYPLPTTDTKVDPQPLQTPTNKNSDCNLNGNSALLSLREISNGNGGIDYEVFQARDDAGKIQPFTLEMKQSRDPYPDLLRCNGFEAISGLQQPGMGMITMNVVRRGTGVLVGGPFNGVSDPVAALKMQFTQSEQLGGSSGSGTRGIIREDEPRGGKG